MSTKHVWRFYRAGGFDQVRLESGADLMALDQLDQKLWVALSCPTRGLEFDSRTLDLIDTNGDGRIRAPEIVAAAKWAGACLKNPNDLLKGAPALPLGAINDATPEGQKLLASAKRILTNLGKPEATTISAEDTADTAKIVGQSGLNGDGVITPEAATDPLLVAALKDLMACVGTVTDRTGQSGVDQAKADQFFTEAQAFEAWWRQGEGDPTVLPLGPATVAAAAALGAVRTKIEDYFVRCRLAAFDPRAAALLNREETDYTAVAAKELSVTAPEVAAFPLARVAAGQPLPLAAGLNPAWADAMARFSIETVKPLLGERTELTEAEWRDLNARLAPYLAWWGTKAGGVVEKLGLPRVRELLTGTARKQLDAMIATDKALEPEFAAIGAVERLVRYHRDLYKLVNNFVTFRDFYSRREKAIFQVGTLYLDQRACDLCIRVEDPAKHAALANLSQTYLAYCDLTRKGVTEKRTIAAAFTDGDSDNLMVGRNGIFYDRQGQDWDATITKIVDHPISIRQAFWSPYKKVVKLIDEQIGKLAAAREKAVIDTATAKIGTVAQTVEAGKPAPPRPPFDVARFAGIFAAFGLALGAIGGALGALVAAFSRLALWQWPLAVMGIILLISTPSMVIAWLKLRQRNLGPILDANGWAINAKALVNIPFGSSLTSVAKLPPGAQRNLTDPYAESTFTRNVLITVLVVLIAFWGLWNFGVIERYLPDVFPKSEWLEQREQRDRQTQSATPTAPAPAAPAAP